MTTASDFFQPGNTIRCKRTGKEMTVYAFAEEGVECICGMAADSTPVIERYLAEALEKEVALEKNWTSFAV